LFDIIIRIFNRLIIYFMKDDQASSTAYTVMQGLLYTAQSTPYRYLVDNETVSIGRQVFSASEQGKARLKQLTRPWVSWLVNLKETFILPGVTLHYALRKRHVAQVTSQAINSEITQIVTLGAGFDALSWRLHAQHQDVNFIEIDHPATQSEKTAGLKSEENNADNMHFLSVDFSKQNLLDALQTYQYFDGSRPTLFICEGVLMYLEEPEVTHLFDSIRQLCNGQTQFLFSALETKTSVKNTIPNMLYRHLEKIGEPITWELGSEQMSNFLEKHSCKLLSIAGKDELLKAYIHGNLNKRLHSGEYFTHCEFLNQKYKNK